MQHERFVTVPGGQVFVKTWEPSAAHGAPIVLFHDSIGCVVTWRDFPAVLAERLGCPVIAYDRLGFGRSTPLTAPPSLRFIAEEGETVFPALRKALGLERCVLFGYSVGGSIAAACAARAPQAVEAVITESSQAFVAEKTLEGVRQAKAFWAPPEARARLARYHGERVDWILNAWFDIWLSPDYSGWTLEPELRRVRCPVLAIHGDKDEFGTFAFPESIRAWAGGPAEMLLLTDCGHVPHREKRREVLDAVEIFLQEAAKR